MKPEQWVILILVVNVLIAVIYWAVNHFRKKEKNGGYRIRTLVMLLCPLIGPCFFFLGWAFFKLFFRAPVDLEDVVFSKDRVKSYFKADEEKERDFVPLEEAIAVTDKDSTRTLMMEVVRRDISHSLSTISLALNSEDSEVSHYAASVLQETLGTLRMDFQKLYKRVGELEEELAPFDEEGAPLRTQAGLQTAAQLAAAANGQGVIDASLENSSDTVQIESSRGTDAEFYREEDLRRRTKEEAYRQGQLAQRGDPELQEKSIDDLLNEQVDAARELLEALYQVLRQRVFSALEQRSSTDMMEEMAQLLDRRDVLAAYEIESVALQHLEMGDQDLCRSWCERSRVLYPRALSSYTVRLRLEYAMGDREGFFRTMEELKGSGIPLDHETLQMIRMFL